jgi:hypothetical protein
MENSISKEKVKIESPTIDEIKEKREFPNLKTGLLKYPPPPLKKK